MKNFDTVAFESLFCNGVKYRWIPSFFKPDVIIFITEEKDTVACDIMDREEARELHCKIQSRINNEEYKDLLVRIDNIKPIILDSCLFCHCLQRPQSYNVPIKRGELITYHFERCIWKEAVEKLYGEQ